MTSAQLIPAILVPLVAWRVYVRFRRNVGRQPLQPKRMVARVILFSVIVLVFGATGLSHPKALLGLAGGLALSVPIALFGLHLTRFEQSAEGKFYTPNTQLGVALTLLFVGRLAYRMIGLLANPPVQGTLSPPIAPPFQSALTLFIFGITAGYYIAYYSGVLIRSKSAIPAIGA